MTSNETNVSLPTNAEIKAEPDPTRRAVMSAIQRLMLGHPKVVAPGDLSISSLAREAGVSRNELYRKCLDLRDRFEFVRDRSTTRSVVEEELAAKLEKSRTQRELLQRRYELMRAESANWKGLVELLERAINVLQQELRREQIQNERLSRRLAEQPEVEDISVPLRPRKTESQRAGKSGIKGALVSIPSND